ncbi:DNA-directed DNA polymerase [Candidatus Aciduliprofundum boonei]|nr:DNA-directed DNA polymerase [Candidatus Aciduliprofundum boonei]
MRTLYFKTLAKTESGYINPKKDSIYMLALQTNNIRILKGNEKDIIEKFVEIFNEYNPDRIVGFKQDTEDFPLLYERAKRYDINLNLGRDGSAIDFSGKYFRGIILKETKIQGRENIDLFAIAWRDFPRLPTKEIDELANALEVKGFERIPQFRIREKSDEELESYLKNYVKIIVEIADAILPFEESISGICGIPIDRQTRMTVGELIDVVVAREMKRRGIDKMKVGKSKKYEGGYVWLKEPGVYENITYLDFQSMYPNIIKAWNISPETVDMGGGEEVEIEGVKHKIKKDVRGVIPELVDDFLSKRLELKRKLKDKYDKRIDAEQKALKVMANAMYGYMGWNGASYYNRNAAELIAALARYYIKNVQRIIEEMGGTIIYVDTDGIQFIGGDWKKIMNKINDEYPLNIELERIVQRGVYWTKKKYAHLYDGKVTGVGVEYIRRDYPKIIKDAQRQIVEHLLKGNVERARELRRKYRNMIKEGKFEIEDIAVVEQLTKKPEEYEKATKASIAAKILMENYGIEVHRGMYIYIAIVKGVGGPTYRARPIEMVRIEDLDLSYYLSMYDDTINRTFEPFKVSPTNQWF